jgi:phosphomannomutase
VRAIPTLKISISGVRGVVGESLTPTLLTRFAQAFGTYVGGGRIVLGRDPRTSGEMVAQAVAAGLLSTGCRIIELGVCPTPTVQLLVRQLSAQGGIAITASHNPPEWNALKFVGDDGLILDPARGRELLDIYHQGDYTRVPGDRMRSIQRMPEALSAHVDAVLKALGALPRRGRPLRVVLDCCNGAGSEVTPRLVRKLGAEVFAINAVPDGTFPRPAEPLPENLAALSKAVRDYDADVGFAQDMDADRLAIISETGEAVGEERTLMLATRYVLEKSPGPVVANLSTTHALDVLAARFNSPVFRSKVGEAHVAEAMLLHGAVIGGEGNGGVIYPPVNFARDSLAGIAIVLHLMADSGKTVSELVADLPGAAMLKAQLPCPSHRIADVLRLARLEYSGFPLDLRDGVKVSLPEGWFVLRGSNTEPLLRLVVESSSREAGEALARQVGEKVRGWLV